MSNTNNPLSITLPEGPVDGIISDYNEFEYYMIHACEPLAHVDDNAGNYNITLWSEEMPLYAKFINQQGDVIGEFINQQQIELTVSLLFGETCHVMVSSYGYETGSYNIDATAEIVVEEDPPAPDDSTDPEEDPEEDSTSSTPDEDEEEKPVNPSENIKVVDPIDVSTGAHVIDQTLIQFNFGQKLAFVIKYNSAQLASGTLGRGWSHNYEKSLTVSGNQAKVYEKPKVYHSYSSEDDGETFTCSTMGRLGYKLYKTAEGYCLDRNGENKEYYDTDGRLIKIVDHQGFETLLTYTNSMIEIKDAVTNAFIRLQLDANGKIDNLTDSYGRTLSIWHEDGFLVRYNDLDGNEYEYTYDDSGRICTGTDAKGTCYFKDIYNADGKVSWQEDAFGHQTMFTYTRSRCITNDRNGYNSTRVYNNHGLLISYTDENGNTTTYHYNSNGLLEKETDALGRSKTIYYNAYDKPTQVMDKRGNITYYTYDEFGNLLSVVYPSEEGVTIQKTFTYNSRNQVETYTDERGTVTTYAYDTNGLPLSKTVGDRTTYYEYENGLLVSETDPCGGQSSFDYYAETLCEKTDPLGRTTQYDINERGMIIAMTDAEGNITQFQYDCNGQKISETDANDHTTTYEYNGNLKLTEVTYADGSTLTHEYDDMDRVIKTTDPEDNCTEYVYDPAGRLICKTLPDGNQYCYIYDAVGNVLEEGISKNELDFSVDLSALQPGFAAYGKIIRTYDANGNVLTQTDQNGLTAFEYDEMNRLIKKTAANGGVTCHTYSPAGDLLTVTDPLGHTTTYTYDAYGNKTMMVDPLGNQHVYVYDANNNLIESKMSKIIVVEMNSVRYEYDSCNQLKKVIDQESNETAFGYDALGRRTTVTDANDHTVTTAYDAVGNVLSVTDAKGNVIQSATYNERNLPDVVTNTNGQRQYSYSGIGKPVMVTDTNDGTCKSYDYDSMGRVVCVTDEEGNESYATYNAMGKPLTLQSLVGAGTTYTYDDHGRVLTETIANGSTKQYTYNEMGLVATMTNAKNQVHQYTYDAAGRPSSHVAPEGTVTYEYDANGNLVKITDPKGIRTRTYDHLNRVTSYTDAEGNTIQYAYDERGKLATLTYPDGTKVHYEYDGAGNLATVTDWAERVTQYTYDENNKPIKIQNANGTTVDFEYDDMQRPTYQDTMTADYGCITCYSWNYDANGRLIREYGNGDKPNRQGLAFDRTIEYNYLGNGWLDEVTVEDTESAADTVETHSYDEGGNLVQGDRFVYDDANNRLISYLENPLTYDADGNLLSATIDDEAQNFAYDSHNRLISAGGVTYEYDPQDLRTKSVQNGVETAYVYNPHARLSRLLSKTTGNAATKYVYGLGLIGEETAGEFKTYHYDYRGSTVAITSEDGEITDTFEYDTYGKLLSHDGTTDTPFLYNGRDGVMTEPNGLYYMRARYYSPDLKRFINADIIPGDITNCITLNRYAYANNNPAMFVDPLGLSAERGNLGPTVLEAAYMAQHIYGATTDMYHKDLGAEFGGWKLKKIRIDDDGFKIGIYYRQNVYGDMEYAFVNKGSTTFDDWCDNFKQPFGLSNDMKRSIALAQLFVAEHPGADVTFIGHSKGGAEAISNAIATNSNAIVFNPARPNYKAYGLSAENYSANITSYVIEGEMLSVAYDAIDALPAIHSFTHSTADPFDNLLTSLVPRVVNMSESIGHIILLPNPEGSMKQDHSMQSIIDVLKWYY